MPHKINLNGETMLWGDINDSEIKSLNNNKLATVVEDQEVQMPLIVSYNLIGFLDNPAKEKFKIENIDEITKIIIGKSGFHLKNITYQSRVRCIWCRNLDYDKTFDITFQSDNENIYSNQIVFWMLKRRVNEVVNYFYKY